MKRTNEEVQDAIKNLAGLTKNDSGSIQSDSDVSSSPDRVRDGARDARLIKIDPAQENGFIFQIKFIDSNTTVWARQSNELHEVSLPGGVWRDGVFHVQEEVYVNATIIMNTNNWQIDGSGGSEQIVGEETTPPNSFVIQKGGITFMVTDDWVFINGWRVCVEPCYRVQQE